MNFTITLTDDELALMRQGLGLLPFDQVAPLIRAISTQVNSQVKESALPSASAGDSVSIPTQVHHDAAN